MRTSAPFVFVVLVAAAACSTQLPPPPPGPPPRDVPVLAIDRFHAVDDGVAIAAQPSDDDLRSAASLGYRTVVNFRTDGEPGDPEAEGRLAASLGMRYVRIPVAKGDLTKDQADRLAQALAPQDGGPALLHCSSGQRAAAVWAMYLVRHRGVSTGEALAAADAAGIGPDLRARLETRLLER